MDGSIENKQKPENDVLEELDQQEMQVQARPRAESTTILPVVVVGHSRRRSVQEYRDRSRAPVATTERVRVIGEEDEAGHKFAGKSNPKNWRSSKSKKKLTQIKDWPVPLLAS